MNKQNGIEGEDREKERERESNTKQEGEDGGKVGRKSSRSSH
jgi:hypothetical protein